MVGAVITAAGMSSRMGTFKPMLQIGAISSAQRIVSTLRQGGAELIVVITGNRAEALEHHLAKAGVVFLRNPDYAVTDMLHSAKLGFAYLQDKCDRVLFTPVDVPLFTADTVRRLLQSAAPVAVPLHAGQPGHPIALHASAIAHILAYGGPEGLRGAIAALETETTPVADEGVLFDMDTPQEYEAMLRYHNAQLLRPLCEVRLAREENFFGPETARFLRLVADTGSVRGACEALNISYSKAWKLLDAIERNYGAPAVVRRRGGKQGGATALTEAGETLLDRYTAFEAACRKAAEEMFPEYFGA